MMRVMHIRHVRMCVSHWPVLVRICVRFAGRITSVVDVPMMDVMDVRMRVHDRLVKMRVLVMFCQV